jgi:hypothetical protein
MNVLLLFAELWLFATRLTCGADALPKDWLHRPADLGMFQQHAQQIG